jgi:hypothetical protein
VVGLAWPAISSLDNLVALDAWRYVIDAGDDVFAVPLFPQRHVSA